MVDTYFEIITTLPSCCVSLLYYLRC